MNPSSLIADPESRILESRILESRILESRILESLNLSIVKSLNPGIPESSNRCILESLHPAGLMRYLGWTVLARFIDPIVLAFNRWRDEEKWQRRYCPACGSLPAMAQLVAEEHGRRRLLSCGCGGTRWRLEPALHPGSDSRLF